MLQTLRRDCLAAILFFAVGMFSSLTFAQQTVSGLQGTITDEQGAPLANSTVTVRNEDSGLTRTATTNATGEYSIRNLPIGENYSVTVGHVSHASEKATGLALSLGRTAELNFGLAAGGTDSTLEEVVVVGSAAVAVETAVGPSAIFGLADLQNAPSINRNITDVIRLDPRVYVDESSGRSNPIQCGGQNPRFNSLTIDGARLNDAFGLNSSSYPTERIPFSFDSIKQVAVELAPFDVEYGGFSACNINAVFKSGGNEIHGSTFYDYTSDSFRGDSLEGDQVTLGDYSEKRFGFDIGGAIIQDKLFFYMAYEKLDGANLFDRGPLGSGAVNEVAVSQADLDEISSIAQSRYQYDPGGIPTSFANEDEKLLLKVDWNINDAHRMAFTYLYNDGFNISGADRDNNELEFSNHLYERGAELNSYIASLYSDWSDKFSTEIRLSYQELDNRQISVGGTDFGEIRVELADVDVYLGGDDSRQSNKLIYDLTNFAFKGNYQADNGHNLSFGVERDAFEVFNLFVQHSETEIRFDGIDNFRNGFADAIYYNNAPSQNPNDAAADWGYEINTVYAQDEFDINDRLSVIAGLRYEWYTTSDKPAENAGFVADYGFSNNATLDGEGLLQPRFGFTYDATDALDIRGGIGLFSGGNPNVWLSNNYSANNVLQFGQRGRSFGYTDGSRSLFDADVIYTGLEAGVPNGPGYGIPSELSNAVAAGVGDNFEINYLDPNFKIPSDWKFALGATFVTANEYVLTTDLLITKGKDTAIVKHGDLDQVGTTSEGYPQYSSNRLPSFVLTNSSKGNESTVISFGVSKAHDNGINWTLGYAYSDAEDVAPMNSSVAFSNYVSRSFFDPQEDVLSVSNYNIKHRVTASLRYEHAFFGDNKTSFSIFAATQEGQPYSRTFDGTINPYGFTPFLDFQSNVLRPGESRNSQDGSWWTKADIKITQEFPGFTPEHKASAFIVIDNFTNFINDDWGILDKAIFPYTVDEDSTTPESRVGDASLYEIRFGIKYDF